MSKRGETLKSVLHRQQLDDQWQLDDSSLHTVLCEAEAIVNGPKDLEPYPPSERRPCITTWAVCETRPVYKEKVETGSVYN